MVLDGIAAERLVVATVRALVSKGIRKSRNTIPSLRSGNGAVQTHGESLVQVRVQGGERGLVSGRQRAEWGGRVAACRGARAANGDDRLGVLFPIVVVPAVVIVVPADVFYSDAYFPVVGYPVLWEGGDDAGHGNGDNERDEGFVEQHRNESSMKEVFLLSSRCV